MDIKIRKAFRSNGVIGLPVKTPDHLKLGTSIALLRSVRHLCATVLHPSGYGDMPAIF